MHASTSRCKGIQSAPPLDRFAQQQMVIGGGCRPKCPQLRYVICRSQGKDLEVQEWDVVLFKSSNDPELSLGRVINLEPKVCTLELLEEDFDGVWVATNEEVVVFREALQELIEAEYSQRQQDRTLNPHGEHAEEVFTLLGDIPEALYGRYKEK